MTKVYRYIGTGNYFPGIPARDLDQADVDALAPESLATLVANVDAGEGVAIYVNAGDDEEGADDGADDQADGDGDDGGDADNEGG